MIFTLLNVASIYGGQEKFLEILGARLVELKNDVEFFGGPAQLEERFKYTSAKINNCLNGEHESVVLVNGNRALYLNQRPRRDNRIWIYVQHSNFFDEQAGIFKALIRRWLMKLLIWRFDVVVRVAKNALPDSLAPNKMTTIYNGVNLSAYPLRVTWRTMQHQLIRLLMVGAINPNKNQRLAIEVLTFLPQAELTIVGSGPEQAQLEVLALQLGVANRVIWAGQQEDTAPYYRNVDILLMLSRFEAMPFVVLEAMASGTPVVGFPVGGVPEVIENGVDGILVDERTPDALAKAIETLADPLRHREMGMRARNKIEQGFTADHMVNGFLQAIEKVRQARQT